MPLQCHLNTPVNRPANVWITLLFIVVYRWTKMNQITIYVFVQFMIIKWLRVFFSRITIRKIYIWRCALSYQFHLFVKIRQYQALSYHFHILVTNPTFPRFERLVSTTGLNISFQSIARISFRYLSKSILTKLMVTQHSALYASMDGGDGEGGSGGGRCPSNADPLL